MAPTQFPTEEGDRESSTWATVVIAKSPRAGRVKTRLVPPFTHDQAAYIAEAALRDTLAAVAAVPGRHVVALDGEPGSWLPEGFAVIPQGCGGLGERLAVVIDTVAPGASSVVVVAMDTPQLDSSTLAAAHRALSAHDAVLGPALDGGYWLIGVRQPIGGAFDGVSMSVSSTFAEQVAQLQRLGCSTALVDPLRDIDTAADAASVADEFPRLEFSQAVVAALAEQRP